MKKYFINLDDKFNNWTVIDKNKKAYVCKCECGNIRNVTSTDLVGGFIKMCRDCSVNQTKFNIPKYQDLPRKYWDGLITRAKQQNAIFNIDIEYVWDLYIKQNKKCFISGLNIEFYNNYKERTKQTCSLIRIDNKKCYIQENVIWAHKHISRIKSDLVLQNMLDICEKIYQYNFIDNKIKFNNDYSYISQNYFNTIKTNAKQRKIPFEINKEDINNIFEQQNYLCDFSGENIKFNSNLFKQTASIDRIDSGFGYNSKNIHVIHKNINMMKHVFNNEYFLELCKIIYEFNKGKQL